MTSRDGKRGKISAFFKRSVDTGSSSNIGTIDEQPPPPKSPRLEFDDSSLERDPALRLPIWQYHVNQRDDIRRAYIKAKAYQPKLPVYPVTLFGTHPRRFNYSWFSQFQWLEYSPTKDAAFCFPCFLFALNSYSHPKFTSEGFRNWKRVNDGKNCSFLLHEGNVGSAHQKAVTSMSGLMNVSRHIDKVMNALSLEEIKKNRLRLTTTIESVRWLALQACAFRGHDESLDSKNPGNFLAMIKLFARTNAQVSEVVLDNAPKNAKYTSPTIQKEVLHIIANRVRSKIREEIGDAKFCILVDEGKDVAHKEQMAIILRFVDKHGYLKERFFQMVEVSNTSALSLKKAIVDVLSLHDLHVCNLRGQGYDGASNMRGAWNGLQALFIKECPYAYYVHCFAHRLNLALVGAAEKETSVYQFFSKLNSIVNIVHGSSKRIAELHSAQAIEIARMLASGERESGRGANQMGSLHRPGATRWSSYFDSIMSLIDMFPATIQVLGFMVSEGSTNRTIGDAAGALIMMSTFEFVFILHLMSKIMGITDMLCRALQQKSLDILNAIDLVSTTNSILQLLRRDGFPALLNQVQVVCAENNIVIPEMSDSYNDIVRSCRKKDHISVEHHYRIEVFNVVIDCQLMELDSRFNDGAREILTLASALEPRDKFKSFKLDNIYQLAEKFYQGDFTKQELFHLRSQLEHYEFDVLTHPRFQNIATLVELSQVLTETNKSRHYTLIDRLIRLVLTLPVSTATTERAFSAMKQVKTVPRNSMEEEFFGDAMVLYIEREFVENIDPESIVDEFYSIKNRRVQLR